MILFGNYIDIKLITRDRERQHAQWAAWVFADEPFAREAARKLRKEKIYSNVEYHKREIRVGGLGLIVYCIIAQVKP